jgi:hypothetical protein
MFRKFGQSRDRVRVAEVCKSDKPAAQAPACTDSVHREAQTGMMCGRACTSVRHCLRPGMGLLALSGGRLALQFY